MGRRPTPTVTTCLGLPRAVTLGGSTLPRMPGPTEFVARRGVWTSEPSFGRPTSPSASRRAARPASEESCDGGLYPPRLLQGLPGPEGDRVGFDPLPELVSSRGGRESRASGCHSPEEEPEFRGRASVEGPDIRPGADRRYRFLDGPCLSRSDGPVEADRRMHRSPPGDPDHQPKLEHIPEAVSTRLPLALTSVPSAPGSAAVRGTGGDDLCGQKFGEALPRKDPEASRSVLPGADDRPGGGEYPSSCANEQVSEGRVAGPPSP